MRKLPKLYLEIPSWAKAFRQILDIRVQEQYARYGQGAYDFLRSWAAREKELLMQAGEHPSYKGR